MERHEVRRKVSRWIPKPLAWWWHTQLWASRSEISVHALRSRYVFPMTIEELLEINPSGDGGLTILHGHIISWTCFEFQIPVPQKCHTGDRWSLTCASYYCLLQYISPHLQWILFYWIHISILTPVHWVQNWYIEVSLSNSVPRAWFRGWTCSYKDCILPAASWGY